MRLNSSIAHQISPYIVIGSSTSRGTWVWWTQQVGRANSGLWPEAAGSLIIDPRVDSPRGASFDIETGVNAETRREIRSTRRGLSSRFEQLPAKAVESARALSPGSTCEPSTIVVLEYPGH